MTPALLAEVHATAFDRPWDAATFEGLCGQTGVEALGDGDGFILIRTVAGESEILTLAVRPEQRRRGLGHSLVEAAALAARNLGAEQMFLEVAEDNAAALALYRRAGFEAAGRRRGYYPRETGAAVDALLLVRKLSH